MKKRKIEESKEEPPTSTPPTTTTVSVEPELEKELSTEESLEQAASEPSTTPSPPHEEQGPTAEEEVSCSSDSTAEKMVSEQSTAAVGGGENSVKADLSSEDSYEMIKEKDIASCDQDFERELDQMIEHIQLEESPDNLTLTLIISRTIGRIGNEHHQCISSCYDCCMFLSVSAVNSDQGCRMGHLILIWHSARDNAREL
eukprot:sb/3470700/